MKKRIFLVAALAGSALWFFRLASLPRPLAPPPLPPPPVVAPPLPSIPPAPVVALTFDVCPRHAGPGIDTTIVRILRDSLVPATFFVSGDWLLRHGAVFPMLSSLPGSEIANHTMTHPHLPRLSPDSVRWELAETQRLLARRIAHPAPYFRPPFGETDAMVDSVAASLGIRMIMFDIASGDPDPAFDADRLHRAVVPHVRGGSIVVMHINGGGRHTAEALPSIIRDIRRRGFILGTVTEALASPQTGGK